MDQQGSAASDRGAAGRGAWLGFGLTAGQEARYRQANLGPDLAQAGTCMLLLMVPTAGFAVNDHLFFGWTGRFCALLATRAGFLLYTLVLWRRLRGMTSHRAYDRAALMWGLALAGLNLLVSATRPGAFVSHALIALVVVFVLLFLLPNRLANQVALSLVLAGGEALLIVPAAASLQAAVSVVLSMLAALAIGITGAWQLSAHRRREFLAREAEQQARLEVEAELAGRRRAEAEIRRQVEELQASNDQMTRFHHVSVGRELRMIELKREVNELCLQCGQPPRYALEFEERRP
jgi:hypothetical protein